MTNLSARETNPTLPTFIVDLAAIRWLTPSLLEVELTVSGDHFTSVGGDQFVYLMVPSEPGATIPDDWTMAAYKDSGYEAPIHGAYYTVRRWDLEAGSMTIWAVRHGHPTGVAAWLEQAGIGDRLAVWGPRHGFGREMPALVSSDPDVQALFVTDESGLAAVAALLEELPPHIPATVLAETEGPEHRPEMPRRAGVEITWLDRAGAEPGAPDALLPAVAALDVDPEHTFVFGAGESRPMSALRRHLRCEMGLLTSRVHTIGYWRIG